MSKFYTSKLEFEDFETAVIEHLRLFPNREIKRIRVDSKRLTELSASFYPKMRLDDQINLNETKPKIKAVNLRCYAGPIDVVEVQTDEPTLEIESRE